MHAKLLQLCPALCDPKTVACQAPLSLEFSLQEYWSGLPFPSLEDLSDPGIKLSSPALQMDSLPLSHQGGPPCLQATFISKAPRKTLAPLGFQPVTYPAAPTSVWSGVRDIFYVTLITSSSVSLFLACFKFHLPSWQKGERKPIRFPSCQHCRIWQKPRRTKLESSLPGTSSPEPSAQVSLQNIYSWW